MIHRCAAINAFTLSLVGEIFSLEGSVCWVVFHVFESIFVSWVPSLAVDKNILLFRRRQGVKVLLEGLGPVWIVSKVLFINWSRSPAPDLVELKENAGFDIGSIVSIGVVGARSQLSKIKSFVINSSFGVVSIQVALSLFIGNNSIHIAPFKLEHV